MRQELEDLIQTMDIPSGNRDLSIDRNVYWLSRNMFVRNSDHANFAAANGILRKLLKDMQKTRI